MHVATNSDIIVGRVRNKCARSRLARSPQGGGGGRTLHLREPALYLRSLAAPLNRDVTGQASAFSHARLAGRSHGWAAIPSMEEEGTWPAEKVRRRQCLQAPFSGLLKPARWRVFKWRRRGRPAAVLSRAEKAACRRRLAGRLLARWCRDAPPTLSPLLLPPRLPIGDRPRRRNLVPPSRRSFFACARRPEQLIHAGPDFRSPAVSEHRGRGVG